MTGLGRLATRCAANQPSRSHCSTFHDRHPLKRHLTKSHNRSLLSMVNSAPPSTIGSEPFGAFPVLQVLCTSSAPFSSTRDHA